MAKPFHNSKPCPALDAGSNFKLASPAPLLSAVPIHNPRTKLTQSLFSKGQIKGQNWPQTGPSESSPELALGRLAIKDFSNAGVLERLLMYERRIENSMYKTLLELQRLNLIKNLNRGELLPSNVPSIE